MASPPAKTFRVLPAEAHKKLCDELATFGWQRAPDLSAVAADIGIVSLWRHEGIDAVVAWIDDQELLRQFYGLVFGPQAQRALEKLKQDTALISPDEGMSLLQHASSVPQLGALARALGILACGPFHKGLFDVLCGLLASGVPALQLDALTGVAFAAWPQFDPVLDRLARDEEADANVRAEALDVLLMQRECDWSAELR